MSEELKPCPFCGGDKIDESMLRGYKGGDKTQPVVAAGCWDCGAIGPDTVLSDVTTGYEEAIAAWNRRPTDTQEKGDDRRTPSR